jgi:hypothetical protein
MKALNPFDLNVNFLENAHVELTEKTAGESGMVLLVINEQHEVLQDQQKAICEDFCANPLICRLNIPANGMKADELKKLAKDLAACRCHIVFASPIPLLLLLLSSRGKNLVGVLHNDKREKKELPNGKVISVTAQEGWQVFTN